MKSECPVCHISIAENRYFCLKHWRMLPKNRQDGIERAVHVYNGQMRLAENFFKSLQQPKKKIIIKRRILG